MADPYRWLEDLDAPATRSWIVADEYAFLVKALAIEGPFPGEELGSR